MAIIKYNKGNESQSASSAQSSSGATSGVSLSEIRKNFLPATPTDEEQTEYDVEKATRFLNGITLYDANGREVEIRIENGNLYIDGNIVAKNDVVAYGTTTSELPTIKDYIEEQIVANPSGSYTAIAKTLKIGDTIYKIEGSGSGEGGMIWGGFDTSTGNAVSNLTYDASTNTLSGTKAKFLAIEGTDPLGVKFKDGYISFYDGSQYIPMYGAYNSNNKLVLDLGNTGCVSEFYGSAFDFYCANGGSAVKLLAIDRTNGLTSSGDVKAKDSSNNTHSLVAKADKATTLSGYGITDANIANGVITLGSNTITPLTSHQSLNTTEYTVESSGTTSASVNILGRNIHNLHRAGHLVWTSGTTHRLITLGTLAYWDGQYDSSKSNLKYCADGTICSTSVADSKISTAIGALTKSSVGLGNVDNTSDANKPISTATQTALNGKADIYKNAIVGASNNQGNQNTTLWYRAGYVVFSSTETWKVRNVTLSISDGIMVDKPNLIFLHARKGSSSIQHIGLYSTNPSNTCAKSYTTDDGKIYVELWCSYYGTSTDYRAPYIVVLQNSSDNGTNVNSGIFTITLDSRGSKPTASDDVTITDSNVWVHLVNYAQKLQTARSLWGNSFDGGSDIDGTIKVGGDYGMVISSNAITNYESATWKGDAWQITGTWSGNGDDNKMLIKTSAQGSSEPSWVNAIAILCSSGKVGIGTISPSEKLHVVGNEYIETSSTYGLTLFRKNTNSGAWMRFMNNNQSTKVWYHGMSADDKYKFVYNAGSDVVCATIDISGNIIAKGDVTAYSDARLKSEIKPLTYRGSLEAKEYVKDGKKSIGFIAQEVRELYPELVIGEEKEDEYLSLNYGAITAVLAAENKELRAEVETLKSELSEIKSMLNKLMEK